MKKLFVFFLAISFLAYGQESNSDIERQEFLNTIAKNKANIKKTKKFNEALIDAVYTKNESEVQRLLKNGADPNGIAIKKTTASPLGLACTGKNIKIVKMLLEYGANPNMTPHENQLTILAYALMGQENTEIVKYLIYAGVNVNSRQADSDPDIFNAVLFGHANSLKLLIEAGADINLKANDGMTLVQRAESLGWKNCYEVLTEGSTTTDMEKFIEIGPSKLVKNLVNIPTNNYYEPFWLNEVFVLPRGFLEIVNVAQMWGYNYYLVNINGSKGSLKPFIIETQSTLQTVRNANRILIFEDLKIRKVGYGDYTEFGIEKETYRFRISEE